VLKTLLLVEGVLSLCIVHLDLPFNTSGVLYVSIVLHLCIFVSIVLYSSIDSNTVLLLVYQSMITNGQTHYHNRCYEAIKLT